jgi:fucose 4-O-acetylase-like acetyltransferase
MDTDGEALPADSPSPCRIEWFDVAKGIGIGLIVLGHVLRGLVSARLLPGAGCAASVDRFLYAFHLPIFFFLAGAVLPGALERPLGAFVRTRALQLGYPYLVWAPAQTLLQHVTARFTNHGEHVPSFVQLIYDPPLQLWFLYALFLDALVLAALWKCGLRSAGLAAVALSILLTERWVPLGGWSILYPTRHYLAFAAVGTSLGASGRLRRFESVPRPALAGLALAGFAVVALAVSRGFAPDLAAPVVVAVVAAAGVLGTLAVSRLLVTRRTGLALRRLGERSLEVFVAHTIAASGARILLQRALHVQSIGVHVLTGVTFGIACPLVLANVADRAGVPLFRLGRWNAPRSVRAAANA